MRIALIALLLLPFAVRAEGPRVLDVAGDRSSLSYTVSHALHTVIGTSKKVQGRAALLADGSVQVMLRVPVSTFDSGHAGRDGHMLETVEAVKFPVVQFKGVAKGLRPALEAAGTQKLEIAGEVEFHGEKQRVAVPVDVAFAPGGDASVKGSFEISLDAFKVQRPSLLLLKIGDVCKLAFDLALVPAPGAP